MATAAAPTVADISGTYELNTNTIPFVNNPVAGWHLLTFADGTNAVARWNAATNQWVWGSLTAPNSAITGVYWLGSDVTDIASHVSTWWDAALTHVSPDVGIALIASLDNGSLSQGQPVIYNTSSSGQITNTTNTPGSEATSSPIIPEPSISTPSIFSSLAVFGSLGFWKGIGLVLAGVLILVFGGLELRRLA
jgi:hypothetical protein